MSVHGLRGGDVEGKLALEWMQLDSTTQRISIQIATDPLFTQNYHHFIVPNFDGMNGVGLAISRGPWFYRVGAWKTTDVSWSGIYGPIEITTTRIMKPAEKGNIKAIHTQPIDGGLRLHTGKNDEYSILAEFTTESSFTIEKMRYRWIKDIHKMGQIDILGLEPNYSYNIRYAQVEDTNTSIVEPKAWNELKGRRSMAPRKFVSNEDRASYSAEKVLLKDAMRAPPRFSSGTDYANWLAMKEKAKAGLQKEG